MSVHDDSLLTARLADAIADLAAPTNRPAGADLWTIRRLLTDAGFHRPDSISTAEWLAVLAVRGGRTRSIMRRIGGQT